MGQPNKDYMNQSLINQVADYALHLAERDAIITEQMQKIKELEKENQELKEEQINVMDKAE